MTKPLQQDIPQHIAIIMDGNGRWAKARGLDRTEGHRQGAETVKIIVRAAAKAGVKYLTLYAFSTENWKRPKEEVDAIMDLLVFMLERETEELNRSGVRLMTIGDIGRLSDKAQNSLRKSIDVTSRNQVLTLVIALNYGSRNEILRAVSHVATDVSNKSISVEQINEDLFERYLYTNGIPDPDLLIRTSGEQRISNFLLWQLAYTELHFTPVTWPDFNEDEFKKAIVTYSSRERRYGMTGDQIIMNQDKKD
ncbi:MAG: isoprenyl transferase [Bacteroidales bacterium]|nr:isoprenyl transferase [Bacteroidales bacterium]HPB02680.1 isoprenyl transferase [Bacteroidales bacterium]